MSSGDAKMPNYLITDDNEYSQLSQRSDSSSIVRQVNFSLLDELIDRAMTEQDLDGMEHLAEIADREACSADAMANRQMNKTLIRTDNGKLDIIKTNISKIQKLRNKIRNLRYVIDNITREKQIAEIEMNKGKNIINQAINDIDKEVEELVEKANRLKDTAAYVGDTIKSSDTKLKLLNASGRTIQDMKKRLGDLESLMLTITEQGTTDIGIFEAERAAESATKTAAHQFAQATGEIISRGANVCSQTMQSALSSVTSFLTIMIANRISHGLLTQTEKTSEVFNNLLENDAPHVASQIIDNADKTTEQLDDEYTGLSDLRNDITEKLSRSNSNASSQSTIASVDLFTGLGLDPGSSKEYASDEDVAIDEAVATEINELDIPERIKKVHSPPSSQPDESDEYAQPRKRQTTEASKESVFGEEGTGNLGGRNTQKRRRNHKKHHNTKRAKKRYTRKLHKNHKRRHTKKH